MSAELTRDQVAAEKLIEKWFKTSDRQIFVLTGYAGTGKTTLLKHVVCETLKLVPDKQAAFVTPTGKAATVLIRSGIPACTIHRLIYQTSTESVETELNGNVYTVEKLVFRRRESIDKDIKLIILDEFSMVSDELLGDIIRFGTKVLLCGDDAQLPPVEGVNSFIFAADARLCEIVRQQEDNPIIALSQMAREGKFIPYGNYGNRAFVINARRTSPESRKRLLLKADQIICGTNKTRKKINDEVRLYMGREGLPAAGDKLICTLNNWEQFIDLDMQFNMVNGIIGTVQSVRYAGDSIGFMTFKPDFLDEECPDELPFDSGIFTEGYYRYKHGDYFEKFDDEGNPEGAFTLNRFEYGYCISCHKAQGSEFGSAIVFDEGYAFKEDKARWLYTAVTRAKEKLIIIR
ncbi:MAG: AAA family ATPase [Clostridia bacterium]|nr:AAA family ATPase [Clostridia bacterium]